MINLIYRKDQNNQRACIRDTHKKQTKNINIKSTIHNHKKI
jgi:hypothetical protein